MPGSAETFLFMSYEILSLLSEICGLSATIKVAGPVRDLCSIICHPVCCYSGELGLKRPRLSSSHHALMFGS
jgi:hypothetical protein